jgi:hypothetical protein
LQKKKKRNPSKSGDLGPIYLAKIISMSALGFLLSPSGKDWPKEKEKKAAARVRMPISQELHFCRNPPIIVNVIITQFLDKP